MLTKKFVTFLRAGVTQVIQVHVRLASAGTNEFFMQIDRLVIVCLSQRKVQETAEFLNVTKVASDDLELR